MIFTLEVLQADYGDSLLLHYGEKGKSKVIVIDGGPPGIYKNVLKPRLLEIKKKLSPAASLPLSMVMVSHMDDDHVSGILAMTDEAVKLQDSRSPQLFDIKNLWFNAFDDIVGNAQVAGLSSVASTTAADINSSPILKDIKEDHVAAVVASTGQGRQLRDDAVTLAVTVNNPFEALKKGKANLVRGDKGAKKITWDKILKITVLSPTAQRLNELQAKWDKDLKTLARKPGSGIIVTALNNEDKSPFNLSSIVCLVECGGKKILLTGDARSDDIVAGLVENKLLDKSGHIHVDILKMPHHGSDRNLSPKFFDTVTADNYVISANGKFNNPDEDTVDLLADVCMKKAATLHMTNQTGLLGLKKKIDKATARMKKNKSKLKLNFRDPKANSIVLNLIDKINF